MWRGRGRHPERFGSYKDGRILEYLAQIAVKYKVDSGEFINCIVDAWDHEESECKQLTIRCREKTKNSAIFLFTNNRKVVAQFPIPTMILQGRNQLESYTRTILAKMSSVKSLKGVNAKIGDLKTGMKKVSLKAKVLELPEPKMVYTRYGTTAYVSNALIKDETGSIRMSLWNQQINTVHKDDVVNIENGKVAWFSGERQLRIGRRGSLNVIK